MGTHNSTACGIITYVSNPYPQMHIHVYKYNGKKYEAFCLNTATYLFFILYIISFPFHM